MKTMELKVARIGNSRGVRLPAATLRRYRIGKVVIMEEKIEGLLLRPSKPGMEKLSWEDTAREMAAGGEDWREWEALNADGLAHAPWDPSRARRVAEQNARYDAKPRSVKCP